MFNIIEKSMMVACGDELLLFFVLVFFHFPFSIVMIVPRELAEIFPWHHRFRL